MSMKKITDIKSENNMLIAHGLELLKEQIVQGKETRYHAYHTDTLNKIEDLINYFRLPAFATKTNFNLKLTQQDCFK